MARRVVKSLPLSLVLASVGVVFVCVVSILGMTGTFDPSRLMAMSSNSNFRLGNSQNYELLSSSSSLGTAEVQLAQVRKSMMSIQSQAQQEHSQAANEASAAAKDRHLQKTLNSYAAKREQREKATRAQELAAQQVVDSIHVDISRLASSLKTATASIKTLARQSQHALASKPILRKEISDTTQRLLELSSEHEYLSEKIRVLSAASKPHGTAYLRDEEDLKSMELHIHQLKAEAKLYSAQASVIADNLVRRLKSLKLDQAETTQLTQESAKLPPRSSVKFATPKFVSLAAEAKSIYSKAGNMINKVKSDNAKALAEKKQLLMLEKEMAAADTKAANIDISASKMSAAAQTQKFMQQHFDADVKRAAAQLAANAAALKRIKTRQTQYKAKLASVDPTVAKDKIELKKEEATLLSDQTAIDTDKAKALESTHTVELEEAALKSDIAGAQKDLQLALGAAMAARVHEKASARLAKEAAVDDDRVSKLASELAISDKKVREARDLDSAADKAKQELAEIDEDDKK